MPPEKVVVKKKARKMVCAGCQEKKLPVHHVGNFAICRDCRSIEEIERAVKNAQAILPIVDDPESFTQDERTSIELDWEAHDQFVLSLNRRLRVLRKKRHIEQIRREVRGRLEEDALMTRLGVKEKLRAIEELEAEKKKKK